MQNKRLNLCSRNNFLGKFLAPNWIIIVGMTARIFFKAFLTIFRKSTKIAMPDSYNSQESDAVARILFSFH